MRLNLPALRFPAVAAQIEPATTGSTSVATDTPLTTLGGDTRTLAEWTTTFHLAVVALDPYTYESAWLLDTAGRILRAFAEADCRTAFVVTAAADEAGPFLGPWAEELLVFVDPERGLVRALGLGRLPAFVHLNQACQVEASAEGWEPREWKAVSTHLAERMSWQGPRIPDVGDPSPYEGTPATS